MLRKSNDLEDVGDQTSTFAKSTSISNNHSHIEQVRDRLAFHQRNDHLDTSFGHKRFNYQKHRESKEQHHIIDLQH